MSGMASTDKGITARYAMAGWLRSSAGLLGQLPWRQVASGLSNITYVVTDETGRRVVVRRPPRGELTGGAHDVLREARILAALRPTAVPVPAVLAACPDPEVPGRRSTSWSTRPERCWSRQNRRVELLATFAANVL
jgi:aminoglycoside phosphotransferase (APT) family kinase protein